jgi:type IV pilus assembly protein PilV
MRKNSGFTFIEIMVCVAILSAGLLGLLGLQAQGLKNNVSANQRTQATLLAYNIIERIRADKAEASKGISSLYVTTVVSDSTAVDSNCQPTGTLGTSCKSANMAINDLVQWNRAVTQQYCNGNGTTNIVCNGSPLGRVNYTAATSTVPAFFTITISWDDNRNGVVDNRDTVDPTKSCYKDKDNAETALPTLPAKPQTPPFDPCFRTSFQL